MSNTAPVVGARSLEQLEQVIQRGLGTFVEVGAALLEIRDGRLYREAHATFEDYCRERWGFNRHRASQLITAAQIAGELVTNVTNPIKNEAQARELARIPSPSERARVWQEVTEEHGDKVTAADIRRAAQPDPPLLKIIDLETGEIIDPEEEESSWHEQPAPLSRRPERIEDNRKTPQDIARIAATNARVVLEQTCDQIRRAVTSLEDIDDGHIDPRTEREWQRCAELLRSAVHAVDHRRGASDGV